MSDLTDNDPPYKALVLANLDKILDEMLAADPEGKRHLATAAKCLVDIEQAGKPKPGDDKPHSLLDELARLAGREVEAPNTETKSNIPEHLKETSD